MNAVFVLIILLGPIWAWTVVSMIRKARAQVRDDVTRRKLGRQLAVSSGLVLAAMFWLVPVLDDSPFALAAAMVALLLVAGGLFAGVALLERPRT